MAVPIIKQRDEERRLSPDRVAEPPERQRAEWPHREPDAVRRQGAQERERRPVGREEVRRDRLREAREDEEVVELDDRSDRRRDDDSREPLAWHGGMYARAWWRLRATAHAAERPATGDRDSCALAAVVIAADFSWFPSRQRRFRCQSRRNSRRHSPPIRATAASSTTAAASCASCRSTSDGIGATVRGAEVYQVQLSQDEQGDVRPRVHAARRGGTTACASTCGPRCSPPTRSACSGSMGRPRTRSRGPGAVKPPELSWKRKLRRIRDRVPAQDRRRPDSKFPADRRIVYVVDLAATRLYQRGLVVDLATQRRAPNGEWSTPKQFSLREDQWADAPDPVDRQIAQMLTGAGSDARHVGAATALRGGIISSRRRSARRCASCARAGGVA